MAGVEQQDHDLLATGATEPVEHEQRVSRRTDRRTVVLRPSFRELPHRGEPLGTLARHPVLAGEPGCIERAALPPGNPRNPARDGVEVSGRRRTAERAGEQFRLANSAVGFALHSAILPQIRVVAAA